MISLKVIDKEYSLPSSWKDVTWGKYCEVLKASKLPFISRLSVYSGINEEILNQITFGGVVRIAELLSFMEAHELLADLATPFDAPKDFHVGRETYGKLEAIKTDIRQSMDKWGNPYLAGEFAVKQYTGKEIPTLPVLDTFNEVKYYFDSISSFLEIFKKLNEYEPNDDELEAGVEILNRFGVWGTAVSYARRTNMQPIEVLERPAMEVYQTLLLDFEQYNFTKNMHQIQERNAKIKQGR